MNVEETRHIIVSGVILELRFTSGVTYSKTPKVTPGML